MRIAIFTETRHLVEELITFLSIFGPQKLYNLTARLNESLNINLNAVRRDSVWWSMPKTFTAIVRTIVCGTTCEHWCMPSKHWCMPSKVSWIVFWNRKELTCYCIIFLLQLIILMFGFIMMFDRRPTIQKRLEEHCRKSSWKLLGNKAIQPSHLKSSMHFINWETDSFSRHTTCGALWIITILMFTWHL